MILYEERIIHLERSDRNRMQDELCDFERAFADMSSIVAGLQGTRAEWEDCFNLVLTEVSAHVSRVYLV